MNCKNIFGTLIPNIAPFLIAQAAVGSVVVVLTILCFIDIYYALDLS